MTQLRRTLGFRDLVLFYVVTTWSLRWIANAAKAGPSSLVLWVIAAAFLFVPLVLTTVALSSRYPDEGGIYVWSKQAFGPFAGFITGWMYWVTNLPYYPTLLLFAGANALFIGGPSWQALGTNPTYVTLFAIAGLTVAVTLNVVGLDIGKWLTNIGAISGWIPFALLTVFGVYSLFTRGSATSFTPASFVPGASLKDLVFFSAIAFAFAGVESGSTMGEEIVDAPRTVPRAVIASGVLIAAFYIIGTWCLLLALPKEQLSGLEGVMQATQTMAGQAGAAWVVPIIAALVTINVLGGIGGWFASTARLPFVAGLDRYLPPAFGKLHPRWHTPYVALLVQAAFAFAFIFIGQAGTTVRGAYDALISMAVITNFIPFLFMFAAMGKLTGRKVVATTGFLMTVAAIGLACVPADDDPDKLLAVIKIVGVSAGLVAAGAIIYYMGTRRK